MTVKKYKVFCINEGVLVSGWSENEPTTCYNNNTHLIDPLQTSMIDIQNPIDVKIIQNRESSDNNDNYYLHSQLYKIEPNQTKELNVDLNINYNLYSIKTITKKENIGDIISIHIDKNKFIGNIESDSMGSTINTSEETALNVKPGYYLTLNGVEFMILSKTIDTITLDNSVNLSTGDPIYMTVYMAKKIHFLNFNIRNFWDNILGSYKITSDKQLGITYENISSSEKSLLIELEMTF